MTIDSIDDVILSLLQMDASISMEQLKDLLQEHDPPISLSRQAIQARVKKLKTKGILKIKGIVDHKKAYGQSVLAFVQVAFLPGKVSQRELANKIAEIPHVYGVWLISGDWDILLKVRGRSFEEIGSLVIDKIRNIPGCQRTFTSACFATVKKEC